jgi:hypothetical protein
LEDAEQFNEFERARKARQEKDCIIDQAAVTVVFAQKLQAGIAC